MKIRVFLIGLGLGVAASAGTIVVDQSQLSDTVYMANFEQTDLAQSFIPSFGNVAGASVGLQAGIGDGSGGDITIALYDNLPNAGGNLLASGTDPAVLAGQLATFMWTPVTVVAGNTYYLVFTSTDNTLGVGGDTTNPYPSGELFANGGYQAFPVYDFTFQTFSDASVPEPSTAAAVIFGLGLLATVGKRISKRV
jgi:hypothetical protein